MPDAFGKSAVGGFLPVRNLQEEESQRKEHRQRGDGDIDGAARQLDPGDDRGAQEGRALGEDVVDAEILAGIFRRNNLGIIGPGKGLDGALEAAHAEGQDAEVPDGAQGERVEADAEVADDAYQDQRNRAVLLRKGGKNQGADPGDHLRREEENHLSDRVQPQVRADIDAVVNNRADAVDVKEEGDQEEKDLLVMQRDGFQGAADFFEGGADGVLFRFQHS